MVGYAVLTHPTKFLSYKSCILYGIVSPFSVGWVKRQRNPTHSLGFMLIAPRIAKAKAPLTRSVQQGYVYVPQPNLRNSIF
jgi:hypothetical protein